MSIARLLKDLDEYTNEQLEAEIELMETDADTLTCRARTLRCILKVRLESYDDPEPEPMPGIGNNGHAGNAAEPEPRESESDWSDLLPDPEPEPDIEPQVDGAAAARQAIAERKAREAAQRQRPEPSEDRRTRRTPEQIEQLASRVAVYLKAAGPTKFEVICREMDVPKMTLVGLFKRDSRFAKTGHGIYGLRR